MKLDEFDPVEVYVAIADFEATEEAIRSLLASSSMYNINCFVAILKFNAVGR